jgi:hypothetical protein
LSASERRIRELRQKWAKGLPGKVLAVYEQELDLVAQVFLTPDGHAQEASLFDEVLATVQANDLWIADRAYCTLKVLFEIDDKEAAFVIRQHGAMKGELLGERRACGRTDTGALYEQKIELERHGRKKVLRRITLVLDNPTRDGDTEIHVLTNLSAKVANAAKVMTLYRQRWTIEKRFYDVTQTLNCEPNTLGYPKAALFAFCLALVASNAVALMKASLRGVYGTKAVDEMSQFYMALEIRQTYVGMMIALPPARWSKFADLTPEELARVLRDVASHVKPARYRKARRGPKKPPTPKSRYRNGGHESTHNLLERRNE